MHVRTWVDCAQWRGVKPPKCTLQRLPPPHSCCREFPPQHFFCGLSNILKPVSSLPNYPHYSIIHSFHLARPTFLLTSTKSLMLSFIILSLLTSIMALRLSICTDLIINPSPSFLLHYSLRGKMKRQFSPISSGLVIVRRGYDPNIF